MGSGETKVEMNLHHIRCIYMYVSAPKCDELLFDPGWPPSNKLGGGRQGSLESC